MSGSHRSAANSPTSSPRNAATTTELRRLRAVVFTAAARVRTFGRSTSCGLDEELLRLQLVIEDVGEVDAEHRLRGRVARASRLPLDHVDLHLVRGDALLQDVDLLFGVRREPLHDESCERVRRDLRLPPRRRLHGDLNERVRGRAHGP